MQETVFVVNAGSSSIKFQLFAATGHSQLDRLMKGQIEGIGVHPHLLVKDIEGRKLVDQRYTSADVSDGTAALGKVIGFLRTQIGGRLPTAIGHRVVHGGPEFSEPTIVNTAVLERLERLIALAPLHQPNNLGPIRTILEKQPQLFQVACFDTAFHRDHSEVADRFAIPDQLYREGVRRYGFHGLSYEYISRRLGEIAPAIAQGRSVVAHLGNGASMCAISAGKSVESSMGFTALDGLPMGTRPGQLDAGVVLFLMREKHMNAEDIQRFLYTECGLKGISGISNDVRDLLASPNAQARLALDCFTYRIALFTGMLVSAMGGIDSFVFTAGIGENAPTIREAVVQRLSWLGLELDSAANERGDLLISRRQSRIPCFVIPTDEEMMIASHTLRALRAHESREKIA